jgi:UDP-glucose 4-epimerase
MSHEPANGFDNRRLAPVPIESVQGRVLVLGAGFIGCHVVRDLIRAGFEVDVVTRSAPRPELASYLDGATVVLGDVSSMSTVAGPLAAVDHVIYAVGSSSPTESDLDPAADVSIVVPPMVSLLELLRLRPSVGLTYLSSGGAVYGNIRPDQASEETVPEPISSYGILKLTCEKYLAMYADLYGVPVRIFRIANAYGPGQRWAKGQGIVARLMRCALTGESMPVYGDGRSIRDYIFIDDVSDVIVQALARGSSERLLNLGSGVPLNILDLVGMVEDVTGRRISLDFKEPRSFDVRAIVLNVDRLSEALPFNPTDIRVGLEDTWRAFSKLDLEELRSPSLPRTPSAAR